MVPECPAPLQAVDLPLLSQRGVALSLKREDLRFPQLSGNKYRKLKYNLEAARNQGFKTLLTFGGAFSNHLHATAAAGRQFGFATVGIVRGEELARSPLNPTLADARANGMQLVFLSREQYRMKDDPAFLQELQHRYGPAYVLPEGGTNALAVKGCGEILGEADQGFDLVCCPVGTGGTLAGLAQSARGRQRVQGYPALRAPGLETALKGWIPGPGWELVPGYHFGGYGKVTRELIEFMLAFREKTGIPLDPVYTGKMVFGILEEVRLGCFPEGMRILAIHTGGLQGIRGMNMRLQKKGLPLL
ncbi:1-aminocyclopropane-1-carboxylate deaminase/D-cysteine desulfhydrase [Robiginitalea marina]|uniref:Pyridoxal-phosphate dependent enzyme n=1 Tax=Robiginitalea marina TaxID=2954105 RepID=A0ABT1B0Z0_9FLAO|nr:pyridoxal-phosphate dependent enzyme [Robiginitalea marina]MCO5725950.1 pyridoxal-phosphate dependent enzyme [Robiginitalea marina]